MMTADNVLKMKNTLEAAERGVGSGVNAAKVHRQMAAGHAHRLTNTVSDENVKLRRTGATLDEIREAHQLLRDAILSRYSSISMAFRSIDFNCCLLCMPSKNLPSKIIFLPLRV